MDPQAASPGDAPAEIRGLGRRLALVFLALAALLATLLLAFNAREIGEVLAAARRADGRMLLGALALQAGAFAMTALVWWRIVRRAGAPVRFVSLLPLSFAKLFADQALPSAGLSGAAFMVAALARRGVPKEPAFAALIVAAASFILAFAAAALFSSLTLAFAREAPTLFHVTTTAFVAFLVLALVGVAPFLRFRTPGLPGVIAKRPRVAEAIRQTGAALKEIATRPVFFLEIVSLQMVQRLLDAGTLWLCLLAVGADPGFVPAFVGVSMASLAATVAPTPMGLGPFEGGAIAALTLYGVDAEAAVAGVLLYRGFTLWLPLAPGFAVMQREILKGRKARAAAGPG